MATLTNEQQEKMKALIKYGYGKRWTQFPYDRVYFNKLPMLFGLTYGYLSKDNFISVAELDGKPINRRIATSYYRDICGIRIFWETIDMRFGIKVIPKIIFSFDPEMYYTKITSKLTQLACLNKKPDIGAKN